MRHIVHLLVVLGILGGVHAYGRHRVEDRFASGTRWLAEATGLTYLETAWHERIRPAVSRAAKSTFDTAHGAISRELDRLQD